MGICRKLTMRVVWKRSGVGGGELPGAVNKQLADTARVPRVSRARPPDTGHVRRTRPATRGHPVWPALPLGGQILAPEPMVRQDEPV